MLKSATRVVLFVVIVTLCVLLFMTLRGDKFNPVFELFKTVVVSVVAFFFGKSTQESMTQTTGTLSVETPKEPIVSMFDLEK